ncbi:MAG: fibrobacter succinogenes major paralogous domain-containing protein [Bacteroidales bacterium]|nr:fibrobacter succinogenes major paralogous domain-containing protein [Bacteroidales bacterium]
MVSLVFTACEKDALTVTDIDGNEYATVTIGSQVWMASSLVTTKFSDGTAIPVVTDNTAWANLGTPGVSDYGNNAENAAIYGKLYNWHAVNDPKGICPTGWRVPAQADWATLITTLGLDIVGDKMKEPGTLHWSDPNTGATNESGFTALGGGYRNYLGVFKDKSYFSGYWSSTAQGTAAYMLGLWFHNHDCDNYAVDKKTGLFVRCIQDI